MEIIKTNIFLDREWKEFLLNRYNLFFDPEFLHYNDAFKKHIKWHNLKFKSERKNKIEILLTGCEDKNNNNEKIFISVNGASFGGFNWIEKFDLIDFNEAIKNFIIYLKENNFKTCIIKNSPDIYESNYNQEYEYALLKAGFSVSGLSITNVINLKNFEYSKLSNPLRRTLRNCEKHLNVKELDDYTSDEYMQNFYSVLFENRLQKNAVPTHSLDELMFLKKFINNRIRFFSAEYNKTIVGICVLFLVKDDVALNFYLATDEKFKKYRAADYLLYNSVEWAKRNNFRLYDIGTSDANGSLIEGLFTFKKKFLAYGFLRKTFLINL